MRSMVRMLAVLTLVISSVIGAVAPASAQAETVTNDVTGSTVEYGTNWDVSANEASDDGVLGNTQLTNTETGAGVNFIFTKQQFNRTEVRDAVLSGTKDSVDDFVVIDAGDYENIAYELTRLEAGDSKIGSFLLVYTTPTGTTVVQVVAEIDSFAQAVANAQAEITLDGAPILDGVDGASLQTQLQVTESSSDLTDVQAPADVETTAETGGGEFVSDVWGYSVQYPEVWTLMDEEIGDLSLINTDRSALIGFSVIENPGVDGPMLEVRLLETFQDSLAGGEFISSASSADRAVFVGESDGFIMIQEIVVVDPSTIVIITLIGDPASMDTFIAQAQQITINGVPILSLL